MSTCWCSVIIKSLTLKKTQVVAKHYSMFSPMVNTPIKCEHNYLTLGIFLLDRLHCTDIQNHILTLKQL